MTATTILGRVRRAEGRPARSRSLRPWYRNGTLMAGLVIVGLLVLVAILAPVLAPYDPVKQDLPTALLPPSGGSTGWAPTSTAATSSAGCCGARASTCGSASSPCSSPSSSGR